jgi:micrococcal nuclease
VCLTVDQQLLRVRLAFIDAPERRQAFGTRAKQAMSDLVFGHEVTLYPHAIDRYGRTVAIVYADDKDIGLEMLKAGLAWPYYRYLLQAPASVQESYRQAADTAQEQRLGLWSDLNPMPPWEWRKGEKETLEDGTGRVFNEVPGAMLCRLRVSRG